MHFDNSEPTYYPVDDNCATRIIEKDYYSNFVCCGIQLSDLHELVNHFEEQHAQETLSSFAESLPEPVSPLSPVIESPVSTCPLTPSPPNLFPTLTAPFTPGTAFSPAVQPDSSTYSEHNYPREAMSVDHRSYLEFISHDQKDNQAHSSFWSSSTSGTSTASSTITGNGACAMQSFLQSPLDAKPSIRQIDSGMTFQPAPQQDLAQGQNDPSNSLSFPPTIAPTPIYARHPNLSIITDLTQDLSSSPEERGRSTSDVPALVDSKEINQSQSGRRKRVLHNNNLKPAREKTYKCPHAGCVKSYLNLNGLKYHLTKGVCSLSF